jgi:formate/nitrite transporter FocA (FNT family)
MAGMAIGLGGCIYMSSVATDYKWVGAVLFAIGLFTVYTFGFDLYTGKVGYAVRNKPSFIIDLVIMVVGNFVGAFFVGETMPMTNTANYDAVYSALITARLGEDIASIEGMKWGMVFWKAVFCGVLMFIAADYYKVHKKYLGAILCVPVFILSGMEHSIADMFYFCAADAFNLNALLFILVVVAGNAVGGIIIPLFQKYMYDKPSDAPKPTPEEMPCGDKNQ